MITNKVYIGGQKYKWVDPFRRTAEWKAIESYANTNSYTLPTNVDAYDQLIQDLKSAGIWQKLDVFYVFAGDGSNSFKLINWKNPNQHYGTAYGGLTWLSDGVKGNGSNGYIDTNYNPSTNSINFTRDDASMGGVISQVHTTRTAFLGASSTSGGANRIEISSAISSVRLNTTTNVNSSIPLNYKINFIAASRKSSTEIKMYIKDEEYTRTSNSVFIRNFNTFILRSGVSNYGDMKVSMVFQGASLDYEEAQSFRSIYNKFLTSLGLTPIA